jgi:hypothetical protein
MTRPSRSAVLAVAGSVAILLPGCAPFGSGNTDPAQIAPATAPMFLEATVDPQGDQETALRALEAKFPGGEAAASGGLVSDLIEQGLAAAGAPIDYATDIQPWLGEKAAVFVTGVQSGGGGDPDVALALSTTDTGASQAAIGKAFPGGQTATHEGVTYRVDPEGGQSMAAGIVDNFMVLATPAGFVATVDASKGEALGEQQAYQDAIGQLPDERLAAFFVDPRQLIALGSQQLEGAGIPPEAALAPPIGGVITADANGLVVDTLGREVPGMPSPAGGATILGELPGNSAVAAGVPDLGAALKAAADEAATGSGMDLESLNGFLSSATGIDGLGLLDWLGDTGVFVSGTTLKDVGGGLVIDSADPDASVDTIASLRKFLAGADGVKLGKELVPGDAGFSFEAKDLPQPVVIELSGSKVAVTLGPAAAKAALGDGPRLSANPDYRAAIGRLGSDYDPKLYVGIGPMLEFVEKNLGLPDEFKAAEEYLGPFSNIIAGMRVDGDDVLNRVRLDIE